MSEDRRRLYEDKRYQMKRNSFLGLVSLSGGTFSLLIPYYRV